MRILSAHNFYREPGGEDEVFCSEATLLERKGHRVSRYEDRNDRITSGALTSIAAVWNHASYRRLRALAIAERPEVAHFHNTFPLISPAAYYALRRQGVPIVQKLSNFRLICPGATLLRDGTICQECIDQRSLRPAIVHRCYRGGRAATAAVCGMIATHRAIGTWNRAIDLYLAPTEFTRRKFIEAGFPPERVVVKQHAIHDDPGLGDGRGGYALFVGRLSPEKGVQALADAWRMLRGIPLRVAGDGPFQSIDWPAGVELLGQQSREQVQALMRDAAVLIVPSIWYEIGPLTVLEAFACGLPVIASDLGSMAERVDHKRTGLLFRPGDAEDLAHQVRWAFDHPERLREMRATARREYELKYTAEVNYKRLIEIYEIAIENHARGALTTTVLNKASQAEACATAGSHVIDPVPQPQPAATQSRHILSVRVDSTTYFDATRQILDWARAAGSRYVCCASVNNIMEAHDSAEFRGVMNSADLVTSDGMPLVWLLRLLGVRNAGRVYGPDLTRHVLSAAEAAGVPVAFFGGSEAVLAALLRRVGEHYPALHVVYAESPPFRPQTGEEDSATVANLARSGARIVFVGLSTPKQDRWMHAHRGKIPGVMMGVGAAFDFLAGAKPQAPRWMQSSGLEWLFRLATEPRRLWRRYLRHNPRFAVLAVGQLLRARHI